MSKEGTKEKNENGKNGAAGLGKADLEYLTSTGLIPAIQGVLTKLAEVRIPYDSALEYTARELERVGKVHTKARTGRVPLTVKEKRVIDTAASSPRLKWSSATGRVELSKKTGKRYSTTTTELPDVKLPNTGEIVKRTEGGTVHAVLAATGTASRPVQGSKLVPSHVAKTKVSPGGLMFRERSTRVFGP